MHTEEPIHFIDAMPGAGKTEYFVAKAVQMMNEGPRDYILVYVAPTIHLLKEAYARLLLNPALKSKLTAQRRTFIVAEPASVAEEFAKPVLIDGKPFVPPYRPITDAPTVALNYLFGLVRARDYKKHVYKGTSHLQSLEGEAEPGSLLMTTHESFVRVFRTDHTGRNFAVMKTMTVIFDEARKCVLDTKPLTVNSTHLQPFMRAMEVDFIDGPDAKQNAKNVEWHGGWNLCLVKDIESVDDLKKRFKVPRQDLIPQVVLDARKKFQQYVANGRAAMYILTNVSAQQLLGKKTDTIVMFLILRPSELFTNYARVILTSAFFKDSQMYHFLKSDGHVFNGMLADRTLTHLDPIRQRDRLLRKAAANRLMVAPLLRKQISSNSPDKLYTKNLTRALLDYGMVLPLELAKEASSLINPDLSMAAAVTRLANGKPVVASRKLQRRLEHYAVPPLWVLIERSAEIFKEWASKQDHLGKPFTLLTLNSMSKKSVRNRRVWTPTRVGYRDVVHTILSRGKLDFDEDPTGSDLHTEDERRDKNAIPDYWMKALRRYVYHKSPEACFTVPGSPLLHGINKYSGMHAFTHLAALNPDPRLIRVYKGLISDYNVDLDHSIENLVQTLYRTNLRDPHATNQVLMIIPYLDSAELLASKIGTKRFNIYAEPRLIALQHRQVLTEEMKIKRTDAISSAVRKYDPALVPKINSTRNLLLKARERLELNPNSQLTARTVKRHEENLARLRAQAAIKKG